MNSKKLLLFIVACLIFITTPAIALGAIISEIGSNDQRLSLTTEENKLIFRLNIPKNHFIYWVNNKDKSGGAFIKLDLKKSVN